MRQIKKTKIKGKLELSIYTILQQPPRVSRGAVCNQWKQTRRERRVRQDPSMDGYSQPNSVPLDKTWKHFRHYMYTLHVDKAFSDRGKKKKKNPRE